MLSIVTTYWQDDTQHTPSKLTGDTPIVKVANRRNCRMLTQTSDLKDWLRRQFRKLNKEMCQVLQQEFNKPMDWYWE